MFGTVASGTASFAHGSHSVASSTYSHADGYRCNASGYAALARGEESVASGRTAHADGYACTASGDSSHAEGHSCTASGARSHAEGFGTIAASVNQHVQGVMNVADADNKYAHIVGGGDWNHNVRQNIYTLDWSGNGEYAGYVKATGFVLTAPNGTQYKLTVDNSGNLTATAL